MLDFKSRGREFESRWGQKKIDLKKTLPWRILISSDFEPLAQYAEWDLKKTSNTLTETLIGLFLSQA